MVDLKIFGAQPGLFLALNIMNKDLVKVDSCLSAMDFSWAFRRKLSLGAQENIINSGGFQFDSGGSKLFLYLPANPEFLQKGR